MADTINSLNQCCKTKTKTITLHSSDNKTTIFFQISQKNCLKTISRQATVLRFNITSFYTGVWCATAGR